MQSRSRCHCLEGPPIFGRYCSMIATVGFVTLELYSMVMTFPGKMIYDTTLVQIRIWFCEVKKAEHLIA